MITYVIQFSGQLNLLGKTLEDQMKIEDYRYKGIIDTILGYICSARENSNEKEKKKQVKDHFLRKISTKMEFYEEQSMDNSFYLGYLSILDFELYEAVNYVERLFPQNIQAFPKLLKIRDQVKMIP